METKRQLYIFTGGFGSGKTETALNFALARREEGPVTLVDLDIVNPYFRSRRLTQEFARQGVRIVSTVEGLETGDTPAFSPAISGILRQGEGVVVMDVGGDAVGATALGSFAPLIWGQSYQMYLVVNPYRPFTRYPPEIIRMLELIQEKSRLRVTGLVANPHLGAETTPLEVTRGWAVVEEVGRLASLPIVFLVMDRKLKVSWEAEGMLPAFPVPILALHRYLEWPL